MQQSPQAERSAGFVLPCAAWGGNRSVFALNGLASLVGRNGFGANFSTAAGAVHGGSAVGHVRTFCIVGHGAVGTRCLQVSDHGLAGQCAGGGCCSGVVGVVTEGTGRLGMGGHRAQGKQGESGDSAEGLCCTSRKADEITPAPDAAMPWHPRAPCSGARVA